MQEVIYSFLIHFLPRAPPWTPFQDLASRRADILTFLDSPFISFHEMMAVIVHLFVVSSASQFSSPSAGSRDDDFDCADESGSSQRSLGSILKCLHARLMMSVKIFIFARRGVCAFTPAKREEKSSFLFKIQILC